MSFKNCIAGDRLKEDGTVDLDRLTPAERETLDLFDELEAQYNTQMGPGPAKTKAAIDAASAAKREAIQRKRRTLLQAQAWRKIDYDISTYADGNPAEMGNAMIALLVEDRIGRYPSVKQLQRAITRRATSKMDEFLATFKRDLIGRTRNRATMRDLVRELFRENTGNNGARELAQAWKAASEYLRQRFNAAGGAIAQRSDWGLPQSHSATKVRSVKESEWLEFIRPLLATERMIDERTGLAFTPETLEIALSDVYKTIATDGWAKKTPSGTRSGGKSVAARRTDHRFLIFKDGDSWLKYQDKFGDPDPFNTMMAHIDVMARDIALMERLGPNPAATKAYIEAVVKKAAAGDDALENAATSKINRFDEIYNATTGQNNAPVNGKIGRTLQGTRQLLQSAQLGSATLLAIVGDMNTSRITRGFNGLPQINTINQSISWLMTLPRGERAKLALRLGLTAEAYTSVASSQARFVGDISGPEITRRISDATMRLSLLSPWTNAGRWSFGIEFYGTLADNVGKAFKDLDPNLRGALERYRIDETRWDLIRKTPLYDYKGAKFLRPDDIAARTDLPEGMADDLADRVLMMVETETDFAIPTADVKSETALIGSTRPGSIPGEIAKSFAMYKTFPIAVLHTHLMRGLSLDGTLARGRYVAGFIVSMTLMAALGVQMKEISKGRDPLPMFDEDGVPDPKFWGNAVLAGGGLSLLGDFLFANRNRYGGGMAETVAGPVVGLANDLGNLTIGNVQQLVTGENTNFGRELVDFSARYFPGNSIWYWRLATERLITDQVRLMTDPKASERMRRLEMRYMRERGQEYWWRPGETAPGRGPDFSNIFGQ